MRKSKMVVEPPINKKCACGNQYVDVVGYLYCHKCDINNDTLKSCYEDIGYICTCDYCKKRINKILDKRSGELE